MVTQIEQVEAARPRPKAVAGFDFTLTVPKSASVLWALADPATQRAVAEAHRAAVDDTLAYVQSTALRTRTGSGGAAQVETRGMVAAAFDHWDTRTGDPNLHTHVVLANKVQGPDGKWRSVDSRALHHAAVAVSELYDDLLADHLTRRLPVRWGWRPRGERRTPAFEIDGLDDRLLSAFSTRAGDIDAALRTALADFTAAHARPPSRVEVVKLRQQVTLATRPPKTPHPLQDLLARWADRARRVTGRDPADITADALLARPGTVLRHDQVNPTTVDRLGALVVDGLLERRSTWTVWNARAEAAGPLRITPVGLPTGTRRQRLSARRCPRGWCGPGAGSSTSGRRSPGVPR
ncbi:MAG TPA: MobF family relaxase [Acidimicrobiales bacterium]